MIKNMFVVPTRPGVVKVKNPESGLFIADAGELVPAEGPGATYFYRRIQDGDLREGTPPAVDEAEPRAVAPTVVEKRK